MRRFLNTDGGWFCIFLLSVALSGLIAFGAARRAQRRLAPKRSCPCLATRKCQPEPDSSKGEWQVVEALDEVNAARRKRGLKPFQRDEKLTQGARAAALYRAVHRIKGHTRDDFAFLPAGAQASAAGCGALTDDWGWATCCTFERWTFAGAAWVRGKDNKRYMHLFVR